MATAVQLITIDEAGYKYLRDSLAQLQRLTAAQGAELRGLRNAAVQAQKTRAFVCRPTDDIDAATKAGDDYTPGVGLAELYTVTTGLENPVYEPVASSRGPITVYNFTCDPLYKDTFPIRAKRLDDTGQLIITDHPADQYTAEALEDIAEGATGDFEIIGPDGLPRVKENVLAYFNVIEGDIIPIFRLSPHDCLWSTLPFPDHSGIGTLQGDAPGGTPTCAGGPTLLNVEELDINGCYVPSLLPDATPRVIEVWNQCDEVTAGRVQYKRVRGGYVIDVECCPAEPQPAPADGDDLTASPTQTQAGALPLTQRYNRVTTVATLGDSVRLPNNWDQNDFVTIVNAGANTLQIWPQTGGDIDNQVADLSVFLAAGASVTYGLIRFGKWVS